MEGSNKEEEDATESQGGNNVQASSVNIHTQGNAAAPSSFEDLGVCEELCEVCLSLGWKMPTEIQANAIPAALKGKDIIAISETGSGKTAAFAIPIIQSLLDQPQRLFAVVLSPTRELCVQTADQFKSLGASIALEVVTIVGGLDMVSQSIALAKAPHVVVASPGRLVDHLENTKGFNLKKIKYLVMDEADKLLSMDFDAALDKLLQVLPENRRTYLFSATMTSKVSKLQKASLKKPVKIEVHSKYNTVKELVQSFKLIPFKHKWTYTAALMKYFKAYSAMMFCNMCVTAKKLSVFLNVFGFASVCLHGKMLQQHRLNALNLFKAGQKKILIATEVGSRGLDIPHVDIVVNFDVPTGSKDYIHRVGRTARAGRSGRAITLVTQYDIEAFQRVEFSLGKKLDEFMEITDAVVMAHHEQSLEALRLADLEIKEAQDEKKLIVSQKKKRKMGHEATKRRFKSSKF